MKEWLSYKDFDELATDLYKDVLEYLRSDNPDLVPNSLIDFLTNKWYNIYIK